MANLKFILILLILFSSFLAGQGVEDYDVKDFFNNVEQWGDSLDKEAVTFSGVGEDSTESFWELTSTTSANTIISKIVKLNRGANDVTAYVRVNSVGGTCNTVVKLGVLKAPEIGIVWYDMADTVRQDTTFTFSVAEQSWGPYEVSDQFLLQFLETGNQKNEYAVRLRHFQWR